MLMPRNPNPLVMLAAGAAFLAASFVAITSARSEGLTTPVTLYTSYCLMGDCQSRPIVLMMTPEACLELAEKEDLRFRMANYVGIAVFHCRMEAHDV